MVKQITHEQASALMGEMLPDGMNWYQLSKLQFFPRYGDWKQTWTEDDGICAIVGRYKKPEPEHELEAVGEVF